MKVFAPILLTISLLCLIIPAKASAVTSELFKPQSLYPVLKAGSASCPLIMKAGKAAVLRSENELSEAIFELKKHNFGIILAADGDYAYAQGVLDADSKYIRTETENKSAFAIYSQIATTNGKKFAIVQRMAYWHQSYDLFLLDASFDAKQLDCEEPGLLKGCIPVTSSVFDRPWLFVNEKDNKIYAVMRDNDAPGINIWNVYSTTATTANKPIATLLFQPPGRYPISIIPKGPLLSIEQALDEMIGPPEKFGHFMGADALRSRVCINWSNLILRPWAVSKPLNTREKVDHHMFRWSRISSKAKKVYGQFQADYPAAEAQLTTYYEQHFKLTHAVASKLAAQNLDAVKRNSFAFPSS